MTEMTARDFISKWRRSELKERSSSQEHFIDLCHVLGHPTPAEADKTGDTFTFEAGVEKSGGGHGWADVWKKDHFAWEYKGPHKDLDVAYNQLLRYHEHLQQPPLLVVSDMQRFVIHTKFNNAVPKTYDFDLEQLAQPSILGLLHDVFFDPARLHPRERPDQLTDKAAGKFAQLADSLRRDHAPRRVAHFLTQMVFCLFAEDIGLLPRGPSGERIFSEALRANQGERYRHFPEYTQQLFTAMATGGDVQYHEVAHFNGGLFRADEEPWVPLMSISDLSVLLEAAQLDWSAIEPSIFGTLFERGLDPSKRSQLGAHYTSKADIMAIVEPVLMAPLRREWQEIAASPSQEARDAFLDRLASIRVLDPACGSGNFLYVSLNLLKDLEKQVIQHPAFVELPPAQPRVSPMQLYGIELSDYAHELASVAVWIGYIQWHNNNGYTYTQKPILQKLDNIRCMDAILGVAEDGTLFKPEWPEVDVIVGNPPFLGGKKMRSGLDDDYVDALFSLYDGCVPREADLVTYWFERARQQIEATHAKRAGLLGTQAIRGGANRKVLQAVKGSGDIFFAYSDRPWVLDGAAVRVSMVGFDDGAEKERSLDDELVSEINTDLTAEINLPSAKHLVENANIAYMGDTKGGAFDIPSETAQEMLNAPANPNGRPNSDVVRKWMNAIDVTRRGREYWVIDFGISMTYEKAVLYERPFEYIKQMVKSERDDSRSTISEWWLHERPRPEMRQALEPSNRYLATPCVSKHRLFVWLSSEVLPDHALIAFARDDDYFFGVLHSRAHEVWALRQGTQLREKESGNRYTPTTTFETFPLPRPPGQEPTDDPRYSAIAEAARELNEKREAWLNPPGAEVLTLRRRTLTNLYNQKPEWLLLAHEKLDKAVFAAYGWEYPLDDEEILRRLLALNLERVG